MSVFERYLSVWVALCIVAGVVLGKLAPNLAQALDRMTISIDGAPVVSIPIAICLFFMMYPIMVKIDFAEVVKAGKSGKPVALTLAVNWGIKPFTMYAIAILFLGVLDSGQCTTSVSPCPACPFYRSVFNALPLRLQGPRGEISTDSRLRPGLNALPAPGLPSVPGCRPCDPGP